MKCKYCDKKLVKNNLKKFICWDCGIMYKNGTESWIKESLCQECGQTIETSLVLLKSRLCNKCYTDFLIKRKL